MDAKHGGHAICEPAHSIGCEEGLEVPLEPDRHHDCVSRSDQQGASWLDPELKGVRLAQVPIFAAVLASRLGPSLQIIIPVRWLRQTVVLSVVHFEGTGIGVPDCEQRALRV